MICWGAVSPDWEQQIGLHQEILAEVVTLQTTNDNLWLLHKDGSLQTFASDKEGFKKMCSEVVDVFAGGEQVFTVDKEGEVHRLDSSEEVKYYFGKKEDAAKVPRPSLSRKEMIIQISCGQSHTLMLSKYGDMFVSGDNSCGQLGLGKKDIFVPISEPRILDFMKGVPISQIAAGSRHSFCVTVSGRAYAWGLNDFGQLGLGDSKTKHCYTPKLLKAFTKHAVAFISSGRHHCALLTKKGELFTFGQNCHGQLGHGNTSNNEFTPRRVKELASSVVTQVSCGQSHTVAFVPGCGQLFVFGSNNEDQLGLSPEKGNITEPRIANGPWSTGDKTWIKKVYAFGNQTFILLTTSPDQCDDYRLIASHQRIATLCENLCEKIEKYNEDTSKYGDVLKDLRCTLGSQSCLNGSFSIAKERPMSEEVLDIDFARGRQVVSRLCEIDNPEMYKTIVESLSNIVQNLSDNPQDIETLKLYLILPNIVKFLLDHSGKYAAAPHMIPQVCLENVFLPFVEKMLRKPLKVLTVLRKLYKLLDLQDFSSCVNLCKNAITEIIFDKLKGKVKPNVIQYPLQMLEILFEINGEHQIVDYKEFYIQRLSCEELLRAHFNRWKPIVTSTRGTACKSNICEYPFVLDAKSKTILLDINSRERLRMLYQPIRLSVKRQNILLSASKQLDQFPNIQLPLEVLFIGEDGVHHGCLNKTFFMLIFEEALQSKYELFDENETSNLLWFPKGEATSLDLYVCIGKLYGMALYNNSIVNFNIPLALYKKLLGQEPDFDDFKEIDPVVGNSLQQLLDFEEDDDFTVEDFFGFFFTSPDGFTLKKGGEDIPVTMDNRQEYVELFLNYYFHKSVEKKLAAFCKGFWIACDRDMLKLFRAEELREMMTGIQDYVWDNLKHSTKYEPCRMPCERGRFSESHPVIKWFWEVLLSMTDEEKDKFLLFLTASNKIPVTGLTMTISQREERDDLLPIVTVCSNNLHLDSYSSKEILEERLKLAIQCKECHFVPQ